MIFKLYKLLKMHYGSMDNWWHVTNRFKPNYFEICVSAILTQNTNWKNVEKALDTLVKNNLVTPRSIAFARIKKIEKSVRSSGFYKQKALRLKMLAKLLLKNQKPSRHALLRIKGIGYETADSILLYAFNKRYFPIDTYTKRVFERVGIDTKNDYESLRKFCESKLPKNVKTYKEFHALLVEFAKNICKKTPECNKCFIKFCAFSKLHHKSKL